MRITGKGKKFVGRRKIHSKIAICLGQQKTLAHTGIFIGIFKAKFDSSFLGQVQNDGVHSTTLNSRL